MLLKNSANGPTFQRTNLLKNTPLLNIFLCVSFLLSGCEGVDEDLILNEVTPDESLASLAIEDALAIFSAEGDSIRKITYSGEVETVGMTGVDGLDFDLQRTFPKNGRSDLIMMSVNSSDYVVHRPSGKASPVDDFSSLDGHQDTSAFDSFTSFTYEHNDIRSSNGHFAFRIINHKADSVELQSAYFDENGLFTAIPVADSKHVAHFLLADSGTLAFTTRDISGGGTCKTWMINAAGSNRLEIQPSVFYWAGASGHLYFLQSGKTESSPPEIHRVSGESELSSALVGYEMDKLNIPSELGVRSIGAIDKKTYFQREWYNEILEFDEETLDLRLITTPFGKGLIGAATAGNYIYAWGDKPTASGADDASVSILYQLDPISEVSTEIYAGDSILVGYVDNDTLWAQLSTFNVHTWIGRMDDLSTLTGPTAMTEVYRPDGTFDGGLTSNYVWLGR